MPFPERSRLFALLGDPEHPRVDLGVTLGTRSHRVPAVSETGSAYRTVVSHPTEDTVRTAHERAGKAGAVTVRTVKGRPLGWVPADATRRSECDVLVVHTTG